MTKETRSPAEKSLLCKITKISAPLPYKLMKHTDEQYEDELYYVIPDDCRYDELVKLWPFTDTPTAEQVFFDIHSQKSVRFDECFIIRYKKRNVIVSKHYWEEGGMVVDLVDISDAQNDTGYTSIRRIK